ncbi:hypothetical protein BGZ81_010378 [Podila clonocystis]|nr:hypothetical protein BGZ81_010378 [Podila clonocystis]
MSMNVDLPPRPDSPGSADLIRHFSRQQEQQAQRQAQRAGRSQRRMEEIDNDNDYEDPDVYEYNQDDELAQYFAQADAALATMDAQDQDYGYSYGGDSETVNQGRYGRGGSSRGRYM